MQQEQNNNNTKWLIALGALVGLCVVSLLCVVVLGGKNPCPQRKTKEPLISTASSGSGPVAAPKT